MVIDAAKGIEVQTRKLFEVCRLRDVPIITFINKLDMEGRDPFELLEEIEQTLALESPRRAGRSHGRNFHGCYDVIGDRLVLMKKGNAVGALDHDYDSAPRCDGLDDRRWMSCCRRMRWRNCATS